MNRSVVAVLVGVLATGAAVAIVIAARSPEPRVSVVQAVDPADYFDQDAATEDRIRALEAVVAEERNARLLVERELRALREELDAIAGDEARPGDERIAGLPDGPARFVQMRAQRAAGDAERRLDRLVEAGISPDRAEWLLRRESELQMEQMQMMFEARQSGEPVDRNDIRLDPESALRAEIGDAEYEHYLEANGRSTSVAVGTVLESSPGQRAGLQPGDEIVAYGGDRVFSYLDLNRATMNTQAGQSVVVDIVRDGVPMQVVVEAGPIGISSRGIRGRR